MTSGAPIPSETSEAPPGSIRTDLRWIAAYVPLALALTWPLAARLGTALAGDTGDGWQNLWNIAWVWRSLFHGATPFFTHDLHHTSGIALVFQTFDLPDAVLFAPLMPLLPPVTVYGLVVLWTFVSSGATGFALGRILGVSRPAAFASGAAFTFSTFHFGHDLGHLHILAMQWLPLFAAGVWRAVEDRSWKWGVFGGVAAGLAGLASWYHLLAAIFLGASLLPFAVWNSREKGWKSIVVPVAALVGSVLVVAGPLALAILRERSAEPVSGAHSPHVFSADVESFVVPNGGQALGQVIGRYRVWSGNPAENASYLGFVLLGLVAFGAWKGAPRVRAWSVAALVGIVLSLGPALRLGGMIRTGDVLPYAWLEKVFPFLAFTGVPVRLGVIATLALAAAAGPALELVASRKGWKFAGILAALAVAEHFPHAYVTSSYPVPAPIAAWADDPARWAVLDATRDSRHLWHQLWHRHPIIGGYTTRTPERLERFVTTHPVAGPLLAWDPPNRSGDIRLESLQFRDDVPIEGADREVFSFDVSARFTKPAGEWTFKVASDDGGRLWIDGRLVVDNGGTHPERTREAKVTLDVGPHEVRVAYEQHGGGFMLDVTACGPDGACVPVDAAFTGEAFVGRARYRRRELTVVPADALEILRTQHVARIVLDARESTYLVEKQLGLRPAFVGDGVRVYEVPGAE